VVRLLPPETAHDLTVGLLAAGLVPRRGARPPASLACRCFGRELATPLGLAAGYDKNAEAMAGLLGLGFSFLEVGTVTPRPQGGNPKPRLFRLPADGALINRMGFNNDGVAAVAARLAAYRRAGGAGVIGVNVGKNKDAVDAVADFEAGVSALAGLADFLVVNVSSPNTPGLRALQEADALRLLLSRVLAARARAAASPPLLVKIAPDLTERDEEDIAAVVLGAGVDGLVVSNTTVGRPPGLTGPHRGEGGGLSGRPLAVLSTALLARMYRRTAGKLTIIGVGGVASGADAYAKIRAGATLVELYTALIYEGPPLITRIETELAALLARDGLPSVAAAVGADHR